MDSPAPKTGYLTDDFRLFHLTAPVPSETAPHYHDFCKILVMLKGSIGYTIEGRSYQLLPGDIVLVNHGEIHCPHPGERTFYERLILYLSPLFLEQVSPGAPLNRCFDQARYRHSSVLRLADEERRLLFDLLTRLEDSAKKEEAYASALYRRTLLLEFLICLNRAALNERTAYLHTGSLNYQVSGLIAYVNSHLEEDLSIPALSEQCGLSPYRMMHLFKEETGCTIGSYIAQKRLALARERMRLGQNATEACFGCGFSSYSAFLRAYKRQFGETPRKLKGHVTRNN